MSQPESANTDADGATIKRFHFSSLLAFPDRQMSLPYPMKLCHYTTVLFSRIQAVNRSAADLAEIRALVVIARYVRKSRNRLALGQKRITIESSDTQRIILA